MTLNPTKNFLVTALAVSMVTTGLAVVPVAPAFAQSTPGSTTQSHPNQHTGKLRLWPDDLNVVQTSKRNDFRLVDLKVRGEGDHSRFRVTAEDAPRGVTFVFQNGNWYARVPVTNPIDFTTIKVRVQNDRGERAEADLTIVVHPGWDPSLPDPGDFPTANPQPGDEPELPELIPNPQPTDNPTPPPTPTENPTPPPTPGENRGPVVNLKPASFVEGSRHEHKFTIVDPDKDALKQALWIPVDGFDIAHEGGDNWKLIITPTVKPGKYSIAIQGEDVKGKVGELVEVEITITKKGSQPTNNPTPPPTPTENPTTPPPTTPPNPAQGPVIKLTGGTYSNKQAHRVPFTVETPAGQELDQVWYYPVPGFDFDVDDKGWFISIDKGVKAGKYELRLYATNKQGVKGPEVNVPFVITDGNSGDERPTPPPTTPPTNDPTPPNPGVNRGPNVVIKNATFSNRQNNTLSFEVKDPDGDALKQLWWYPVEGMHLRHIGQDRWAIDIDRGIRTGKYDLELWATDVKGNEGPKSKVTITITGNQGGRTNAAPVIQNGRVRMYSGYGYSYQVPVRDPEGDKITLKIVSGKKDWMRINGTKLELRPPYRVRGTFRVVIEANDGHNKVRGTYDIYVN